MDSAPKMYKKALKNTKIQPKIAKLNKKFVQFQPKTVKNVDFGPKFTLKKQNFHQNQQFSDEVFVKSYEFYHKFHIFAAFGAKTSHFLENLITFGPKIAPNVIKNFKNLLRFAYCSNNYSNKRGFSADAAPLSSALRPRLLKFVKNSKIISKFLEKSANRTIFHWNRSNFTSITANFCPKRQKFAIGVAILAFFLSILGFTGICINDVSALSLSMTIPKNIELSINPNANNGFGESNAGEISISTDSISGYTLNVKAKNSSNDLVNSVANTKLTSITDNLTLDQYKNGSNGKTYLNTWGFKPSHINNEPNTNYVPGPDNVEGITLAKTDVDNSIPATYAVAIAAKVDNTISAGNYSNTFVLTATANEAHYTINYDVASLSDATNAASFTTQTGVITGNTQQINTTTPTKTNYEFLGWCDQSLESDGTCKGSVIQPGGNLRMCKCDTDVTLYAMWNLLIMQYFECNNLSLGQSTTLIDQRDDNSYTVTKLQDNKCWMTQNLRLGKATTMTLTSSDSDVSSNYTLPASNASGFSNDSAQNIYVTPSPDENHYGGYYTWAAATAGTSPSSGEAPHSICPKGWRLPTNTEFDTLMGKYDSSTIQLSPANFSPSGLYIDSSPTDHGANGYWWSSTANSSTKAYAMYLTPSVHFGSSNYVKRYGFPIRCVSRQ